MNQHTLKIFKVKNTEDNTPARILPVYTLRNGKFFRTAFHPDGWSEQPDYDLGNDGRIYRTENHPDGFGDLPDYEFGKDMKLYRTSDHPEGERQTPDYEIND